jgi:hypothetical protein
MKRKSNNDVMRTKIVPVPEVEHAEEFKYFRPIGISHFLMILMEKVYHR